MKREIRTNQNSEAKTELPVAEFKSAQEWGAWLAQNHAQSKGVWLRFFKKNSGISSITYSEALDEALCYGWIDGQVKKYDSNSYLQKFTTRRPRSLWSKRNVGHAERLMKAGKMAPAGHKEIKAAKADGRWERAYDSPSTMEVPPDFIEILSKNPKAEAFFRTLNRTNTYAIAWRLQTAGKPEIRARRMQSLLEMLTNGEKLH